MKSFFDVCNNLCAETRYNFEEAEPQYNAFMINRSMSQHYDVVMLANEMNRQSVLTKQQQYDFYHHSIQPKKKRFAAWAKPKKDIDIDTVAKFFQCSHRQAEEYYPLLSAESIDAMKKKMDPGGR